jgi:ribosomal protein S27AE
MKTFAEYRKILIKQNRLIHHLKSLLKKVNYKICPNCGAVFIYKHKKQIYCSSHCRKKAWEKRTGAKLYVGDE